MEAKWLFFMIWRGCGANGTRSWRTYITRDSWLMKNTLIGPTAMRMFSERSNHKGLEGQFSATRREIPGEIQEAVPKQRAKMLTFHTTRENIRLPPGGDFDKKPTPHHASTPSRENLLVLCGPRGVWRQWYLNGWEEFFRPGKSRS